MSKTDLINYINERYSTQLDEYKIYNYQAILNESIDLKQMVDDIYLELTQTQTSENKLLNVLDYLDVMNYSHASYIIGQYYFIYKKRKTGTKKIVKKYMRKAAFLKHPAALYFYYKNYDYLENNWRIPTSVRVKYLIDSAKQNYPEALTEIGWLHLNGIKGFPLDTDKALEYFEKAAAQNDSYACYLIADTCENSLQVKLDYERAAKNYKRVIEINDKNNSIYIANSCERLGCIYEFGLSGNKDTDEAIKYYNLGIEYSSVYCSIRLAIIYFEGKYCYQDIQKAYQLSVKFIGSFDNQKNDLEFINIIEDAGLIYYIHALLCIDGRIGRYSRWTEEQRKENYIYFLSCAAMYEHNEAQYILGCEYYNGDLVEQNKAIGKEYLTDAAKNNHPKAQYLLSDILIKECRQLKTFDEEEEYLDEAMYWLNKFSEKNFGNTENLLGEVYLKKYKLYKIYKKVTNNKFLDSAIYWFKRSIVYENKFALVNLGKIYLYSEYGVSDKKEAFSLLKRAALARSGEAYYLIGMIYYHKKNYEKTILGFQKAIELDYILYPADMLGMLYENGIGVEQDYNKAKEYYELSIKHGAKNTAKLNNLLSKMENK